MADIVIKFRGEEFIIPESKAFAVGERVEDIATLSEVYSWLQRPRYHKMARCLGAMIRFAGGVVTDEDVHRELMTLLTTQRGDELFSAVFLLTDLLMHGAPEKKGDGETAEKPPAS